MSKTPFGLGFTRAATAYLDQMPSGKLRAQIVKKAKALVHNPHPAGSKKLKAVEHGSEPVWRVRSGDSRILYVVREAEVIVLDIGHRKDVYK